MIKSDTNINVYRVLNRINSALSCRQDGQNPNVFGAVYNWAGNTAPTILNAVAVTPPFTIAMNRTWAATFNSITVKGRLTATGNYTTTGTRLKFRLVMTEKEVNYTVAPESNSEKEFHWVARKSFPNLTSGTDMANKWLLVRIKRLLLFMLYQHIA